MQQLMISISIILTTPPHELARFYNDHIICFRFLPATKTQPQAVLSVVDKPVTQYVVEEAISSGIEDILIITVKGKRAIG
jgi:hypothetical protein